MASLKPLIRYIREGRPFYYLPDQDLGERASVFVPVLRRSRRDRDGPEPHRAEHERGGHPLHHAHTARGPGVRDLPVSALQKFPER